MHLLISWKHLNPMTKASGKYRDAVSQTAPSFFYTFFCYKKLYFDSKFLFKPVKQTDTFSIASSYEYFIPFITQDKPRQILAITDDSSREEKGIFVKKQLVIFTVP